MLLSITFLKSVGKGKREFRGEWTLLPRVFFNFRLICNFCRKKSSTVWIQKNCIVNSDKVSCNNCARHCPTGAILMVPRDPDNPASLAIPIIDTNLCIGCGACEYFCPARPESAIYVEGHERHHII